MDQNHENITGEPRLNKDIELYLQTVGDLAVNEDYGFQQLAKYLSD